MAIDRGLLEYAPSRLGGALIGLASALLILGAVWRLFAPLPAATSCAGPALLIVAGLVGMALHDALFQRRAT